MGNMRDILTQKGGIGASLLCFDENSIHFDKNKYFYYEIEPEEAVRNLEKIVDTINQERYEGYDEWTEKALNKICSKLVEHINTFMMCEEGEMIYCDMSEYLPVIKEDYVPTKEIGRQREFIDRLLQGSYVGAYPKDEERVVASKMIEDFKEMLLQEDSIESIKNSGMVYDYEFIKVGNSKLLKFIMDITIKEEYLDRYNNFENFYHRVYRTLETLEIGVEQNFNRPVENGFSAIFYSIM